MSEIKTFTADSILVGRKTKGFSIDALIVRASSYPTSLQITGVLKTYDFEITNSGYSDLVVE